MTKTKLSILFAVFMVFFLMTGCSSSDENGSIRKIDGIIVITGNEPFTHPSLQTASGDIFVIDCDDETTKYFFKNQGEKFTVSYSAVNETPNGKTLKLVKFEKL